MSDSNLSKTKPAFRTRGGVTGNFGAGRRKGGSKLDSIPASSRDSVGNFPSDDEYRARMVRAFELAETSRLRNFCLSEIARLDRKAGRRLERSPGNPKGAHCVVDDHFVGPHQ